MGQATKKVNHFMEFTKEYTGVMRLGETTATMDAGSSVEEVREWKHITGIKWQDVSVYKVVENKQIGGPEPLLGLYPCS